jgi:hypothetical protein
MHISSIATEAWATTLTASVSGISAVLVVIHRIKAFVLLVAILTITAGIMLCNKLAATAPMRQIARLKR